MSKTIKQLIARLNKVNYNSPEAAKLRKQLIRLETINIKRR